jgi:hypothetical protein
MHQSLLPVMIHVGQNFSPMRAILPLLKHGDIVTHMYGLLATFRKRDDLSESDPEARALYLELLRIFRGILSTIYFWSMHSRYSSYAASSPVDKRQIQRLA